MNNYEYSVQSSLVQHGMHREDLTSAEHVADVQELEYLLNDSLAKQRVNFSEEFDRHRFAFSSLRFSTNKNLRFLLLDKLNKPKRKLNFYNNWVKFDRVSFSERKAQRKIDRSFCFFF